MLVKPTLGMQLQRGHLLSKCLVGAWLKNEYSGCLINNYATDLWHGDSNAVWEPYGLRFNASEWVNCGTEQILPRSTDDEWTISQRLRIPAGITGDGCCWTNSSSEGAYDIFLYAYRSDNNGTTRLYCRNSGGEIYVGSDIRGLGWIELTVVLKNYMACQYINGVYDVCGNIISGRQIGTGFGIGTGVRTTGFPLLRLQMTGDIAHTFLWHRALSEYEIRQLYHNPYAMFRRDDYCLYSIGEPYKFKPYWIPHNSVIGSV